MWATAAAVGARWLTVTVSTGGGLDGGGAALVGPGADVAVLGGSVALVLSVALVSATATPPMATTATTAANPNTNCGSRCHVPRLLDRLGRRYVLHLRTSGRPARVVQIAGVRHDVVGGVVVL